MYLLVPGFEPMSTVFQGECVTYQATVADYSNIIQCEIAERREYLRVQNPPTRLD